MRRDDKNWDKVIDSIFDGQGVVEDTAVDSDRISQYRKMAQAFKAASFEPSAAIVDQAKAILSPQVRRKLRLFLAPGSALASGARLAQGSEAQFVLQSEDVRIRLMLERTTEGWNVTGQASNGPWLVEGSGVESVTDDSGRFMLTISGESSALTLRNSDAEFIVPPYEELAELGRVDQ